jgi:hypothetical protein
MTSPPGGFRAVSYADAGASLRAPRHWAAAAARAPLIATLSSGRAVIALWRYPARPAGAPPSGFAALTQAMRSLLGAARARDPGLRVLRSGLTSVDGAGAVELDVLERINGRLRRVRSEHIYLPGGEIVLEEYAPPALFPSVDHTVFSPVRRSLRLLPGTTA